VSRWEDMPFARRAWLKMALWGAAGLSLLPSRWLASSSSGADEGGASEGRADAHAPLLARWAELGRVWRDWSAAAKPEARFTVVQQWERRRAELWKETDAALGALPAWPELRLLFVERSLWIADHEMSDRWAATCYVVVGPMYEDVGRAIFRQTGELEKLVAEGKLTRKAAEGAAHRLALHAEYKLRSEEAWEKANPPERFAEAEAAGTDDVEALLDWREVNRIERAYKAGRLPTGAAAELAGRRVVELIADDLGMLAGEPTEEELPTPKPADDAAKEGGS